MATTNVSVQMGGLDMNFESMFQIFMGYFQSNVVPRVFCCRISSQLKKVYLDLQSGGVDGDAACSSVHAPGGEGLSDKSHVAPINITTSTYQMLQSLETLGKTKLDEGRFHEAYVCYKMAHGIYAGLYGVTSFGARDLKRSMARALLTLGDFRGLIAELQTDVTLGDQENPPEASLYLNYAYGRSLLATGSLDEGLSYLLQNSLATVDVNCKEHMEVLMYLIHVVMELFQSSKIVYSVYVASKMLEIFQNRLQSGECPTDVFDMASCLGIRLLLAGATKEVAFLHGLAAVIHAAKPSLDTLLLLSAIGCSRACLNPEDNPDIPGLSYVTNIHDQLLSRAGCDDRTVAMLTSTCRVIFAWADRNLGLRTIVPAYRKVSHSLPRDDPRLEYFRIAATSTLYAI